MRLSSTVLPFTTLSLVLAMNAGPALAAKHVMRKPSAQAIHCSDAAKQQNLTGKPRSAFVKTCMTGPLAAKTPTAPTASSKEAQAVTKPSGVDRTTRTRQCGEEADRKHLSGKNRKSFQLSCLATAGPVSEGETATKEPHPANQIKGIGVNNYKPSATTAKSTPKP